MWSTGRSEPGTTEILTDLPVPLEVRSVHNARRLRLRYDEHRGVLKLTCPPRFGRRKALAWVAEQQAWIARQIASAGSPEPMQDGATIPYAGAEVRLSWRPTASRVPRLLDGEIVCGGPVESFGSRIERFLKAQALQLLSAETAEYAAKAGVQVQSVAIGDPATRWGSCSSQGRIRFSWRLILAPPCARRFVVAHEVAHLVHLHHGPEFKALEAQLFEGNVAAARNLLRRVSPRIRRIVARL